MKALLVAMSAFLLTSKTERDPQNRNTLLDTFTDAVKSITEENKTLVVRFQRHSELFRIDQNDPQYTIIKAKLEKAEKIAQKIKIIAVIPSMTIKEVKA